MTVILQRLLHWNGCSCAFTHKLALSTLFFKDCSHTGVIRLLQRKKSLKGIITTSASAFKTHTLLTVPSWQETSGWKWKIRHQAGFSVTVRDTSLPCWSDFSLTESPRTDVGLAHFLLSNTDTHSLRLSFMKLPVLVYICSVVTTSLVMGVNEKMSITSFGLWELRIFQPPYWVGSMVPTQYGGAWWCLLKKQLKMELPMKSTPKDIVPSCFISLNSPLWRRLPVFSLLADLLEPSINKGTQTSLLQVSSSPLYVKVFGESLRKRFAIFYWIVWPWGLFSPQWFQVLSLGSNP